LRHIYTHFLSVKQYRLYILITVTISAHHERLAKTMPAKRRIKGNQLPSTVIENKTSKKQKSLHTAHLNHTVQKNIVRTGSGESEMNLVITTNKEKTTKARKEKNGIVKRRKSSNKTNRKRNKEIEWDDLPYEHDGYRKKQAFTTSEIDKLDKIKKILTPDTVQNLIIPLITQKHKISLRILEWLATNYSKEKRIVLVNEKNGVMTDIFSDYNTILSGNHRAGFDSFKRSQRVYFQYSKIAFDYNSNDSEQQREASTTEYTRTYETTVAQLYFLSWVISSGILRYAEKHLDEITDDIKIKMKNKKNLDSSVQQTENGNHAKRKRKELTKSPNQKCIIYAVPFSVDFDT
jgi:hypothetical protein